MSSQEPPFINRELSWLEFNQRILDQARNKDLPLFERLKFLAITGSNLDEFFMVRVGGLQMLVDEGIVSTDPSGMSPLEQLESISTRAHQMSTLQYGCLEDILSSLALRGIERIRPSELTEAQLAYVEQLFTSDIFPILSPIAVTPPINFPLLQNRGLNIAVRLKHSKSDADQNHLFAIIPIGKKMSRLVALPSVDTGYNYILLEDIILMYVNRFFPGEVIAESVPFRITRNADLSVREDQAFDLLAQMEEVLDQRKRSDCARLEISSDTTKIMLSFLQKSQDISDRETYLQPGPLDIAVFMQITELSGYKELKYEPWPPQLSPAIPQGTSIFTTLSNHDVTLCHPFESFEPVVRLIDEAADDPDVITIKQILYRTSRTSPIVAALIRAAEKGKYVTAMVELKARFDEERNIEWARELEDAGVQVLYGVKGLKTHAKVCLIIRREAQGLVRYMHFGTGNYNELTAHLQQ